MTETVKRRLSARLYRELLLRLDSGLAIVKLENGCDPRSLRLLAANAVARRAVTGASAAPEGKLLLKTAPKLFETQIPGACVDVVRSGRGRDLGELQLGDADAPAATYAVKIYPLASRRAVLVLEDITERKRAEAGSRESQARFRAVFENAAIGIALLNKQGHPVESNPALQKMLGYSGAELANMAFVEFTHPEDVRQSLDLFTGLMEGKHEQYQLEKRYCRKDGTAGWGQLTVSAVRDQGGEFRYAIAMGEDISERKLAEEGLRASEGKFRALAESSSAAIFVYQGKAFCYANPAMEVITGYSQSELLKMNFWDFAHPDFRPLVRWFAMARQRREPMPLRYEFKIVTKAGEERWLDVSDGRFELAGSPAVVGMAFDVSKRKEAEEELRRSFDQLRALAARLQTAREEERARAAREIHDQLGQDLTAIKIDLSSVIRGLPEDKRGRPESILKLVDQTIQSVRRISTELRPAILDAVGLVAAVEWAAEEFQTRNGIRCRVNLPADHLGIEPKSATALFRILQETLTNVVRHANATEVWVRLAEEEEGLTLEVRDNGKGIDTQQLSMNNSLGILGMRERALLLGGELDISGVPGKGTTVRVLIPKDVPWQGGSVQ